MPDRSRALAEGLNKAAAELRRMADALDWAARGVAEVPSREYPDFATVASSAQHAVLTGLADLDLPGLTDAAADADWARAQANDAA